MEDREFKLEVLRLILESGTPRAANEPLAFAESLLQWCVKPIDKGDEGEEKTRRRRPRKADLHVVKPGQPE
jgi:hypothetical protein